LSRDYSKRVLSIVIFLCAALSGCKLNYLHESSFDELEISVGGEAFEVSLSGFLEYHSNESMLLERKADAYVLDAFRIYLNFENVNQSIDYSKMDGDYVTIEGIFHCLDQYNGTCSMPLIKVRSVRIINGVNQWGQSH
jgi:hypothetical protein